MALSIVLPTLLVVYGAEGALTLAAQGESGYNAAGSHPPVSLTRPKNKLTTVDIMKTSYLAWDPEDIFYNYYNNFIYHNKTSFILNKL